MRAELTGQRFGRLVVLSEADPVRYPSGQVKRRWVCRCDCGAGATIIGQNLTRGATASCGCLSKEQSARRASEGMVGSRFGMLLVVERAGYNAEGAYKWLCLCDCGESVAVRGTSLRKGTTKSCGCQRQVRATLAKIKPIVKYLSAHDRIRRARGPAKTHSCVDCGGVAREWSYNGGDPEQLFEVIGGSRLAYSLDIWRYSPRCKTCHARFDRAARGVVA